ncbi:MAG: aminotransferase class V-fold PLP-dependent enzyme [Schleiferiaceae bacterium]|nr:aminotransferase class V-fold PLP-dependent enzyme [Schleiferiaceae bacterium]
MAKTALEKHFAPFRENTVGLHASFEGPYGQKKILYADWIASGRLYRPIEERLSRDIGPYVANTHTETSYTGAVMTQAYHQAREQIKAHLNARAEDVLIPTGTGMTGAVLKFQRILGLKLPEQFHNRVEIADEERPVVFISHMEHHSNQTSWLETTAEVVQIHADGEGLLDLDHLRELLKTYQDRPVKIASITSCSNVTGIFTPYHQVAELMHAHGGVCFVDFACSGPYVPIDMHPADKPEGYLDALFFSPHKFLGGPGSPGILVFSRALYKNEVPDQPGGGTVSWTNPWGGHRYVEDIEAREDGGTPGFMQTIRAALAMQLKEQMDPQKMQAREEEQLHRLWPRLEKIPNLHLLAGNVRERLGALSFYIEDCHYNLVVSLLNDLYGIQTRGGCSCAGTYGHYLLHVDPDYSQQITDLIDRGDLSLKPGWVRLSLHPIMNNAEIDYIAEALEYLAAHWQKYAEDYHRLPGTTEYQHRQAQDHETRALQWLSL